MPKHLRPTICAGSKNRAIRSTLPCLQRSRPRMRAPSPPEKIYSPHRTSKTCCGMAVCVPIAMTSFKWIRHTPTELSNMHAPWTCSSATDGPVRPCSPTEATKCLWPSPEGLGLGGAESYPGVFGPFGGFADDAEVENGCVPLSERPGIGFEGQAALYAIMRALAA